MLDKPTGERHVSNDLLQSFVAAMQKQAQKARQQVTRQRARLRQLEDEWEFMVAHTKRLEMLLEWRIWTGNEHGDVFTDFLWIQGNLNAQEPASIWAIEWNHINDRDVVEVILTHPDGKIGMVFKNVLEVSLSPKMPLGSAPFAVVNLRSNFDEEGFSFLIEDRHGNQSSLVIIGDLYSIEEDAE